MVLAPPHQKLTDPNWNLKQDAGGYFPDKQSAENYAAGIANKQYHKDRLRALKFLLDRLPPVKTVIDYGIADGGEFLGMGIDAKKVIGTDISPHMIDIAKENLTGIDFSGLVGSVEVLSELENESADLILCINVLAYLTEAEQVVFFKESQRLLKQGGHLVVMTGNKLFDFFALNSGTVEFFAKEFELEVDKLLSYSNSERFENADRRNPLNFHAELSRYGFSEQAQSFSQWHRQIPVLGNIENGGDLIKAHSSVRDNQYDANNLSEAEKWKALFRCSMFASLSVKI
jgi:SAM-dependent methyltransferase